MGRLQMGAYARAPISPPSKGRRKKGHLFAARQTTIALFIVFSFGSALFWPISSFLRRSQRPKRTPLASPVHCNGKDCHFPFSLSFISFFCARPKRIRERERDLRPDRERGIKRGSLPGSNKQRPKGRASERGAERSGPLFSRPPFRRLPFRFELFAADCVTKRASERQTHLAGEGLSRSKVKLACNNWRCSLRVCAQLNTANCCGCGCGCSGSGGGGGGRRKAPMEPVEPVEVVGPHSLVAVCRAPTKRAICGGCAIGRGPFSKFSLSSRSTSGSCSFELSSQLLPEQRKRESDLCNCRLPQT